jgi:hypothetical protein
MRRRWRFRRAAINAALQQSSGLCAGKSLRPGLRSLPVIPSSFLDE